MNRIVAYLIVLLILSTFWWACKDRDDPDPYDPYTYVEPTSPSHFPLLDIPDDNPTIAERITLGRYLYYDTSLSMDSPQKGKACSSCHRQQKSFSSNNATAVLPHINLAWNHHFLWNGLVEGKLEDITHFELAEFFLVDPARLSKDEAYVRMFEKAFHSSEITLDKGAKALAQFFRRLVSANSRYDRFLLGTDTLTESEYRGYQIFNSERGDCFHCHVSPLMTDNEFHNTGLETKFTNHLGRYAVSGRTGDVGSYKTPTLRNIAITGPYMHDDRFTTLEEVIEHYNSGVLNSPVLDPIMTKPGKERGLNLSNQEITDLVAFLNSLTDDSYLTNPDLSSPFK